MRNTPSIIIPTHFERLFEFLKRSRAKKVFRINRVSSRKQPEALMPIYYTRRYITYLRIQMIIVSINVTTLKHPIVIILLLS